MAELELKAWVHPSMRLPFKWSPPPFKIDGNQIILELMEAVEEKFEQDSQAANEPHEMQINVVWNVKDHKKALDPNHKISTHFASGDQFGLYGDVIPARPNPKQIPEEQKLPVLILTGFLGSGKTTLLNYILKEQKEKKIAIIENEFGEVSIDDELLNQNQKMELAEKIVVMDNGCMCCTIRGDLEKGLLEINQAHQKTPMDAVIIETTGMADPVPIVRTFMSSEEITAEMRLDGVLTVTDAKNLIGRLDDVVEEGKVNEAYQQVAFADKIILNKLDLINTEQAIAVKDRIRSINAFAKILPAVRGKVKLAELTDIRAHDMANFVNADIEKEAEVAPELGGHGHGHDDHGHAGHGDGHGHSGHGDGHGHGGHSDGHEGHGDEHGHAAHEGHTHDGHDHCTEDHGHGDHEGHSHGDTRHDTRVNSFAIVREGDILPRKLSDWMQSLAGLPEEKGKIFRIKAILSVKGHPFKHVFHAVMDVSDEDDAGPWQEGEKRVSKIVFIGKSLDRKFLTDGFNGIFE